MKSDLYFGGGIIIMVLSRSRIDVMVDIETLGDRIDSTIIQISAVAFKMDTGEHLAKFNRIADISQNEPHEMDVSGSTLKWWINTDKELLSKLLEDGFGSSKGILEEFYHFLTSLKHIGDLYLWGNGILFDNAMISYQLDRMGLDYPIFYRNDRDMRTLVDLAGSKMGLTTSELREKYYDRYLTPHDVYNDCINQINLVVNCYRELTTLYSTGDEKSEGSD